MPIHWGLFMEIFWRQSAPKIVKNDVIYADTDIHGGADAAGRTPKRRHAQLILQSYLLQFSFRCCHPGLLLPTVAQPSPILVLSSPIRPKPVSSRTRTPSGEPSISISSPLAEDIACRVRIPAGSIQQVLHPIWGSIAEPLGKMLAVLAFTLTE